VAFAIQQALRRTSNSSVQLTWVAVWLHTWGAGSGSTSAVAGHWTPIRQAARISVMITPDDARRLLQWQRRMVIAFIGTWVYLLLVIAAHVLLELPPTVIQLALIPALVLVIAGVCLQFSIRCPSCGYRLGRQSRLTVPDRCRSCGVSLRISRRAT
jgi:hypothetical protein